ncbi:hypothetical protein [Vulgatibacter incomptus]|uniref:Uncharacterized protein n=1 Tax=Vulgatibacter incomptus TaxID=1391653 RepID=A0A0K1PCZ5_9BACT|nr:hypothetical protein [Vulgatibacter incomptus]AKU91413.1 hypothetical protein AKJ08_1800 [Vulgatibacter incomptus]
MAPTFPPCGLYVTTEEIGQVPAGRLVLFHDHGDPGPGIYLPESWAHNRANFSSRGITVQSAALAATLKPLLSEGLYRVEEAFTCCAKNCRTYPQDSLVQLGYDGAANAILFEPSWGPEGLQIPESGQRVDDLRLSKLAYLMVREGATGSRGIYH